MVDQILRHQPLNNATNFLKNKGSNILAWPLSNDLEKNKNANSILLKKKLLLCIWISNSCWHRGESRIHVHVCPPVLSLINDGQSQHIKHITWPHRSKTRQSYHAHAFSVCTLNMQYASPEAYYLHEVCQPAAIHTTALYSKCMHAWLRVTSFAPPARPAVGHHGIGVSTWN